MKVPTFLRGPLIGFLVLANVLAIGVLAFRGLWFSVSQHTFLGTVERFVTSAGEDDRVSIRQDGEAIAKGFEIHNVIAPPFYWSVGAWRIRDSLIVGQSYCFTTVGVRRRWPRAYPTIIRFEAPEICAAEGAE